MQQYFHLWSNYAEKHRQMLLPLTENTEICPVNIADVCKVIESLLLLEQDDKKNKKVLKTHLDDQHDGQVYTLTGPEAISGKRLVELLTSATGYQQFKYCHGRPMDVGYYLSGLSKDVWFDARLKQEMAKIYRETFETAEGYKDKAYAIPTGKVVLLLVFLLSVMVN